MATPAWDFGDPNAPFGGHRSRHRSSAEQGCDPLLPDRHYGQPGGNRRLAEHREGQRELPRASRMETIHVEGPYILAERRAPGARIRKPRVAPPSIDEFEPAGSRGGQRQGWLTFVAGVAEAPAYIKHIVSRGAVASIGHQHPTRSNSRRLSMPEPPFRRTGQRGGQDPPTGTPNYCGSSLPKIACLLP